MVFVQSVEKHGQCIVMEPCLIRCASGIDPEQQGRLIASSRDLLHSMSRDSPRPAKRVRRGSDAVYTPVEDFAKVPLLSCKRKSPQPCINQRLVDELKPLREERFVMYGSEY